MYVKNMNLFPQKFINYNLQMFQHKSIMIVSNKHIQNFRSFSQATPIKLSMSGDMV